MPVDHGGAWAASGTCNKELLAHLLSDDYFARPPPKSTGRDAFSDAWLDTALQGRQLATADVQATLAELTAKSIATAIAAACAPARPARVLVCGGGAFNADLMRRLTAALPGSTVENTGMLGIPPEHVESAAFAWLAHRYLAGLPGNIPAVTGARHPVPLGALFRGGTL
jgi:anhydro-N-acetylmuramic acid kinase